MGELILIFIVCSLFNQPLKQLLYQYQLDQFQEIDQRRRIIIILGCIIFHISIARIM